MPVVATPLPFQGDSMVIVPDNALTWDEDFLVWADFVLVWEE